MDDARQDLVEELLALIDDSQLPFVDILKALDTVREEIERQIREKPCPRRRGRRHRPQMVTVFEHYGITKTKGGQNGKR